jgi:starch synthase
LRNKATNTHALRERFGLHERPNLPLLGVVSRLIHQKGVDLVAEALEAILAMPAQLVVLGSGDAVIENAFRQAAQRRPDSVGLQLGFDEDLSHLVEAGADIFLMPSRFEPCGLNQMYSQRYGTPPVVRRTGGLADSVVDCTPAALADGSATGFVFEDSSVPALLVAIRRAIDLWHQRDRFRQVQRNGMGRDFSWGASAERYLACYRAALAR